MTSKITTYPKRTSLVAILKNCTLLSVLLFVIPVSVFGQINIRGIVTNEADKQPIQGTNVLLLNEQNEQVGGAVTDRNGLYRINNISSGEFIIRFSYIGFKTYTDTLQLEREEDVTIYSISLEPDNEQLDELVVSVESEAARLSGGHQKVAAVDLTRVVTPAAGGDMASYLQALPGVVSTGDRGGQLFVRGGTPSENMVLIDGLTIYQPFHIVGFFSAFPEDLLANADFYAGGFSPKYNGRISSVLDVQMRDGDFDETQASASISPFIAEFRMEGPLREGNSSWLASVRSSQIERTSNTFIGELQPLKFESQFLKFSQLSDDGTRCSTMAMRTYDRGKLDFERGNSFQWTNFVIGGKCTHLSQDPDVFIDFSVGLSHLSNKLGGSSESDLSSRVTKFSTNLDVTQELKNFEVNYGFNSHMKWIDYDIEELFQIPKIDTNILLGLEGYLEATVPIGSRVEVKPGSSLTFYMYEYAPSFEPRLRMSWQPFGTDNQELNASVGIYKQTIAGISDLRDVGSAFIAWLRTPNGKRMEAMHTLVGWQQRFKNGFQFSIEGYYKKLNNIPVSVWSTIAEFTTDIDYADGDIIGSDIRIEYGNRWFYGFLGYGLTWTEYQSAQDNFEVWFGSPVQTYNPAHDRRHQINSMASVNLGKYTFGIRWQLNSGSPYTKQMGFDSILPFDTGLPDVRNRYGSPRAILDKPFEGRTPTYHRLDISLEREFDLRFAILNLQAGAINAYDQVNMFYYDVFTQRRIDQLNFAPYASLKMEI